VAPGGTLATMACYEFRGATASAGEMVGMKGGICDKVPGDRAMRKSARCFPLLWVVLATGCIDDGNKLPDTMVFPGTFLRSTIGCQRERDEVVSAAQTFLGCSPDTTPIDVADGVASSDPTQAPSVGGPSSPSGNGAAGGDAPAVLPVGMGGASGTGAPPANAGTAGVSSVGAVGTMCGSTTCAVPAMGQACCLDATTGVCGMQSGTLCVALPDPNAPCPGIDLTRQGYGMLAPCCTADRQCGVNTQRIPGGMPCTTLTEAKRQAENMGYRDLVPPPRACPPQ
jgi:hypothetical protein